MNLIPRLRAALLKWLKPLRTQVKIENSALQPDSKTFQLIQGGKSGNAKPSSFLKKAASHINIFEGLKRYHAAMKLKKASQTPTGVMLNIVSTEGVTLPPALPEPPTQAASVPAAHSPGPSDKSDSRWLHLANKDRRSLG